MLIGGNLPLSYNQHIIERKQLMQHRKQRGYSKHIFLLHGSKIYAHSLLLHFFLIKKFKTYFRPPLKQLIFVYLSLLYVAQNHDTFLEPPLFHPMPQKYCFIFVI